jgi:hypothetical protein
MMLLNTESRHSLLNSRVFILTISTLHSFDDPLEIDSKGTGRLMWCLSVGFSVQSSISLRTSCDGPNVVLWQPPSR